MPSNKAGDRYKTVEGRLCNVIRSLGAAMPNKAKSGHPGAPIGCGPMALSIFRDAMRYDPDNPAWEARDRFVLSNGHASALIYSLLYLFSSGLEMEDLKKFRQLHSKTPGHPEAGVTPGVEVTTGPLGQGVSQAVGMAMAQRSLAAGTGLTGGKIFVITGDGCLQEGVSHEACALAGHQKLSNLIVLWDDNGITIDGSTELAFSEDVSARFRAYGWQVIAVTDGNEDIQAISSALEYAKRSHEGPTLIRVKTTIGYTSPREGTAGVHGSPIGEDTLKGMRTEWGLPEDPWVIPDDVKEEVLRIRRMKSAEALALRGAVGYEAFVDAVSNRGKAMEVAEALAVAGSVASMEGTDDSTRNMSGKVLNAVYQRLGKSVIGGSADLTGSNMTALKGAGEMQLDNPEGQYIRFGVREFGMAAITAGIVAFGGFRPFCSTFMEFVTYAFPSIRLSALSKFGFLFIATHDSIELGEDGPTHQPVEVLPLIRATPNCIEFRPADSRETIACYALWLSRTSTPIIASLSRGKVDNRTIKTCAKAALRGAYIVRDASKKGVTLVASGTELQVAAKAADLLEESGIGCAVVSAPSLSLFDEQEEAYRRSVIPDRASAFAVEASSGFGWERYVNLEGSTVMASFGESAPAPILMDHFGFTPEKVKNRILKALR